MNIYSLTRTLHCLFFNVQSPELALIKGTFILYHLSSSLSSTFFIFLKFFLKCSFQAVFTAPLSPTAFLFYHILPLLSTLFCIFLFPFLCPYFVRQHLGGALLFLILYMGFRYLFYANIFSRFSHNNHKITAKRGII